MANFLWHEQSIVLRAALITSVLGVVFAGKLPETDYSGGTVSVEEARDPLSGKALKMILDAQHDLRSGQHARGMEKLRKALEDPKAQPYAVSMLGVEHLKANQLDAAIPELEEAVRLLPGRAEIHSNLGYALGLTGQAERGLNEARKALQLDPRRPKTRLVLGMLLLQLGLWEEGVAHLKIAAPELPTARKLLDSYALRTLQAKTQ